MNSCCEHVGGRHHGHLVALLNLPAGCLVDNMSLARLSASAARSTILASGLVLVLTCILVAQMHTRDEGHVVPPDIVPQLVLQIAGSVYEV